MAEYTFNDKVNPKAETKLFKIYADVGDGSTEDWELQGRGIESWTIEEGADVTKTTDVLNIVDMERGPAQPTQSGISVKLRKGSKLAEILMNAWLTRDMSALNSVKILQKFEFLDGATQTNCVARLEKDVMIVINSFTGEAGSYLGFEIDMHYANNSVLGEMAKTDGETIKFVPATGA